MSMALGNSLWSGEGELLCRMGGRGFADEDRQFGGPRV